LIRVVGGGSAAGYARQLVAFRKGLGETGYAEGQNVIVEYPWLEVKYDRLRENTGSPAASAYPRTWLPSGRRKSSSPGELRRPWRGAE